ncbi:MAG: PH domain-containing protein [Bifidobacteriaceae bacterium]|nr:PH domain-containing protein [Bifidobacteriaceae bacterium]
MGHSSEPDPAERPSGTVHDDGTHDAGEPHPPYRFRSASGPWLAGFVIVLAAFCAVDLFAQGGLRFGFRWLATCGFIAVGAWAVFWSPRLVVADDGVAVRNVARTFLVPWAAIELIDTKWSLTLVTAGRRVTAWAAPAPSRRAARRATPDDVRHLPRSAYGPGRSVRPGDLASAPSGQAAIVLRERWERLRDAGRLGARGRAGAPEVVARWRRGVLAALVGLAVVAVLAGLLV